MFSELSDKKNWYWPKLESTGQVIFWKRFVIGQICGATQDIQPDLQWNGLDETF